MSENKVKLIIWDFDGVISDSEELWIKIWQNLVNEKFGLNWDFEMADKFFGGLAPKTKIANMAKIGITIDDAFLQEVKEREKVDIATKLFATPGVEKILKNITIPYSLATGGFLQKTEAKLEALNFKKYFPDNHIFTAEQVKHGKPEPDLFLFAAEKMGVTPNRCVVIEDSLAGLTAAIKAKMLPIAFVGSKMNNTPEYIQKVKNLGVELIFDNMKELQDYLERAIN